MADPSAAAAAHNGASEGVTKHDFLHLITGAGAASGAAAIAWPLIDPMNPWRNVLALSPVEFDLTPVAEGQGNTIAWQGKPIFMRHRMPDAIEAAPDVGLNQLLGPLRGLDKDRLKLGYDQLIVLIGIRTHQGCMPPGNKTTDPGGEWGGGFWPCHGSQYATSGRVRHAPAPANLAVPPYAFATDTKIKVG